MIKTTGIDRILEKITIPKGTWQQAIMAAFNSTKQANPNSEVWAYLDRKSFKGWQRSAIIRFLEEQKIPLGRTADFLPK